MQKTALDPTLPQTPGVRGKDCLRLVIGSKNYSSWSMRPWAAMTAFGIPFLFGRFSIADAYFAPVVMRFLTYRVSLAPALQVCADRMLAHPAVAQWMREAFDESDRIEKYETCPE